MVEIILLLITFIFYYFNIMTVQWGFNIFAFIVFELVLLSICLFIIINRYKKIKKVTLGIFIKGAITLLFMSYLLFLFVLLMTIDLRI